MAFLTEIQKNHSKNPHVFLEKKIQILEILGKKLEILEKKIQILEKTPNTQRRPKKNEKCLNTLKFLISNHITKLRYQENIVLA